MLSGARPPVADLRVPDPGLPDPARRAAPVGLRVAARQHLGLPVLRLRARRWHEPQAVWWQVFVEPIFDDYYTPQAGRGVRAAWSGRPTGSATPRCWPRAWCASSAGGTAAATSPSSPRPRASPAPSGWPSARGSCTSPSAIPGCKFLPDLQDYRTENNDYHRVVNAYEPHEHVYEGLMTHARHGAGARRRHRRVPGAAAADGRPAAARAPRPRSCTCSAPSSTAPTTARPQPAQHVHAPQGRGRLGLPGLQLPEVGVGRPAQAADAQARGRGAGGALQADGRHQHAVPPLLAEADEDRAAARAGTS